MKALIVSTSDTDGGAARAAFRLHQGLQRTEAIADRLVSQMLVQVKQSDDAQVIGGKATSGLTQAQAGLRLTLDQLPLKKYRQRPETKFSPQWLGDSVARQVRQLAPDVVNLHWVNNGFVQIETLAKLPQPIVWTLHDMWAFTGGCHYDQGCDRYQERCYSCPQLQSHNPKDLAHRIWQRKLKAFKGLNLTIVTPSQWLQNAPNPARF